jgi:hypothetical protein
MNELADLYNIEPYQDNSDENERLYVLDNKKFPSVTTVIGKFEDKSAFFDWRARVGPEEAKRVSNQSSALGTHVHKLNELYYNPPTNVIEYTNKYTASGEEQQKRHELFLPLLQQIEPFLLEKKLMWEGIFDDQIIGYGGSPDIVARTKHNEVFFEDKECTIPAFSETFFFVGDYKNWRTAKNQDRLISKFLQLAAYTAAVNKKAEGRLYIKDAFIFGTSKTLLYVYHLSERELQWYWGWFKEILQCYWFNKKFNWSFFNQESSGYYRDVENDKWARKEDHFLGRRLYVKSAEELAQATDSIKI